MGAEFVSGLGQGIAQAQQQAQQQEFLDLQKKLLKAQAKAAEIELETKAKVQGVMGRGIEQMRNARPDGTMPAPYQNAGQPAPKLTDILTQAAMASGDTGQIMNMLKMQQEQGQIAGQNAIQEQILARMSGGTGGQGMTESYSLGPRGATVNMEPTKGVFREVTDPGGGKSDLLVDPITGQPMGGGMRTAPAVADLPAPASEYAAHLDPKTLGTPQGLMTLNQLAKLPRVTDEQFKNVQSSKRSLRLLDGIRPLSDKVFAGINDIKDQLKSGVKIKVQSALNQNTDIALYESRRLELLNFVRAIQGAGTITETDADAAASALADLAADKLLALPDTEKTAHAKMDLLEKSLGASIVDILGEDSLRGEWRGASDGWGIVK